MSWSGLRFVGEQMLQLSVNVLVPFLKDLSMDVRFCALELCLNVLHWIRI